MARRGVKVDGRDYYDILGVDSSASSEQIKATYRNLVRQYHPDLCRTYVQKLRATRKLQEINAAYAVLSNAEHRRAYDRQRAEITSAYAPSASQRSKTMGQASSPPRPPKKWWQLLQRILGLVLLVIIWIIAYFEIYAGIADFPYFNPQIWWQSLLRFVLAVFISFMLAMIASLFAMSPWVMLTSGIEGRWKSTKTKPAHVKKDLAVRVLAIGLLLLGTLPFVLKIPNDFLQFISLCFIAFMTGPFLLGESAALVAYVGWARKLLRRLMPW